MSKRFYILTRDLHLYIGLFLAPFVLVFSISVFFLVHSWIPGIANPSEAAQVVTGVALPANIESLEGRDRVNALRSALVQMDVAGEIGSVRYMPKVRRLVFPVLVPGRETRVALDLNARTATITQRDTGVWDGLVSLHKLPGPHLVNIRMNWFPMRAWRWFADGTVYLLFFISISGLYLWMVLRAERGAGLALLAAGALSFMGVVYAVVR